MEHESFENEATAAIMNENFINIKVDREERPDIDHTYMDALQAMTGQGGWPLNIFLTPQLKPFYGGTYYPPSTMHRRMSWVQVLEAVQHAWVNKQPNVLSQADELTKHLQQSNSFGNNTLSANIINAETLTTITNLLLTTADVVHGGFGHAPKFPQFHSINYLLQQSNDDKQNSALQQATLSLTKMLQGGIYDQLRGGMARYSTDANWLVPHFEKMLYDNALLISTLSNAVNLTNNHNYTHAIHHTIAYLFADMQANNKLFYAAQDADSEGVEGKFYCFTVTEIEALLTPEETVICLQYYNITTPGNFTEPHHNINTNILHCSSDSQAFAKQHNITIQQLQTTLTTINQKLLTARNLRIPPATDTKCLLAWNALTNIALVNAYTATNTPQYLQCAIEHMQAMLHHYVTTTQEGVVQHVYHSCTHTTASITAFLDDVAYLINALLTLYNSTLQASYANTIQLLITYVQQHYASSNTPYFYYTQATQAHTIVRKKEVYDGPTPSGNSIMAMVLYKASAVLQQPQLLTHAITMVNTLGAAITKHPSSFGVWASLVQHIYKGNISINISNLDDVQSAISLLNKHNLFNVTFVINDQLPAKHYMVCHNQTCLQPTNEIDLVLNQIKGIIKGI